MCTFVYARVLVFVCMLIVVCIFQVFFLYAFVCELVYETELFVYLTSEFTLFQRKYKSVVSFNNFYSRNELDVFSFPLSGCPHSSKASLFCLVLWRKGFLRFSRIFYERERSRLGWNLNPPRRCPLHNPHILL